MTDMEVDIPQQIRQSGWAGPIDLLASREVSYLSRHLQNAGQSKGNSLRKRAVWNKELAVTDHLIAKLARDERILGHLRGLLGNDILLWGATVVDRPPGAAHPWHTDIETAESSGNAISVWIALENASQESSLAFVSGSHLYGKTIQEVAKGQGISRQERGAEVTLALAKSCSEHAVLAQPAVSNGQMLLFDGRVWHGSLNMRETGSRRTLILQYASPGFSARIPDWSQLEWPFKLKQTPRPPSLLVSGHEGGDNRLVAPPTGRDERRSPLKNFIASIPEPLPRNMEKGWRQHHFYNGSTPVLSRIGCHASILEPGHSPHPPHSHHDEELLIVLDGEAQIVIAESAEDNNPRVESMIPGDLVFYPSYQFHTIRCVDSKPVSYLMYRWSAPGSLKDDALKLTIVKGNKSHSFDPDKPFSTRLLFEGKTDLLDLLHVHLSTARQGGGYEKHRDAHDVAIVLLDGSVKTLGETVSAPAVLIHPAGAPHGLRGATDTPARYIVAEFHGPHGPAESLRTVLRRWFLKIEDELRPRIGRRVRTLIRLLRTGMP